MIARPRVEVDRGMRPLQEIVANIADRSHDLEAMTAGKRVIGKLVARPLDPTFPGSLYVMRMSKRPLS